VFTGLGTVDTIGLADTGGEADEDGAGGTGGTMAGSSGGIEIGCGVLGGAGTVVVGAGRVAFRSRVLEMAGARENEGDADGTGTGGAANGGTAS
jgi:hypothetical protein